jgi:hypothetical protein
LSRGLLKVKQFFNKYEIEAAGGGEYDEYTEYQEFEEISEAQQQNAESPDQIIIEDAEL